MKKRIIFEMEVEDEFSLDYYTPEDIIGMIIDSEMEIENIREEEIIYVTIGRL